VSTYDKLDQLISIRIASGHNRLAALSWGDVGVETRRLEALTGREAFRILDGRLRQLRKSGVATYSAKDGWRIIGAGTDTFDSGKITVRWE